MSAARLVTCTGLALLAFAGNSILCRAALGLGRADPDLFSWVRLASGAAMLALLVRIGASRAGKAEPAGPSTAGPGVVNRAWAGALALTVYAAAFSWAYVRIPAGVGALVLFATTQATMIGWALWRGERPRRPEVAGILIALFGLVGLASPGRTAPDFGGVGLMAAAGAGWGAYSLLGRRAFDPVAANAAAFLRSAALATILLALTAFGRAPTTIASGLGSWARDFSGSPLILAVSSGALASALGYVLWYAALPHLSRTRAALLQLTVPVLAALAGALLLGESVTLRLVASGAVILGGVGLALFGRSRR